MSIYLCKVGGFYASFLPWSFSFKCETTVAESTVSSTLASAFTTLWNTTTDGYTNYATAGVTVTYAEAATLNPSLRLLSKTTTSLSLAGTTVGQSMPYSVGALVSFYNPAFDTKAYRTRLALPTPAAVSADLSGGYWSSAFLTSLDNVLGPFWTSMHGLASFQMTSYNRLTNKQGEAPFTRHALTNWHVSTRPCSRRQRVRKQLPSYSTGGTL